MQNGTLKPYLAYSTAGHAALVLVLAFTIPKGSVGPPKIYTIQFIGASPSILNRSKKRSPAKKKKTRIRNKAAPPAPQKDPDAFARGRGPRKPLPRPSFAINPPTPRAAIMTAPVKEKEEPVEEPAAEAAPSEEETNGGEGPSLVMDDMPDFPAPWYISTIRTQLSDRWSERGFQGSGECSVVFTLMRSGRMVDLRVEYGSGSDSFDYAALTAVQKAAPFAPLPAKFKDPILKIHVQFKAN